MNDFDAVVLAAGRGLRLRGVVPPFFKPLSVVDGKSLIVSAISAALDYGAGTVWVVVAPENTSAITAVVHDGVVIADDQAIRYIVQPTPQGPGDALRMVLPYCQNGRVLVLMSDNVFSAGDVEGVLSPDAQLVIGTTDIFDPEQAARFTRINRDGLTFEGEISAREQWHTGMYRVWLGPVVVDRDRAIYAFREHPIWVNGELKIGPVLGRIPESVEQLVTVPCNTHDVGVLNGEWSEGTDP